MAVYLLHLDQAIGDPDNPHGQAQHYIGWCASDVDDRLADHQAGRGAAITRHLVRQGVSFEVVRAWIGDRSLERRLKSRKGAPHLCPLCNPEGWHRLAGYAPSWRHGYAVEFGDPVPRREAPAECPF